MGGGGKSWQLFMDFGVDEAGTGGSTTCFARRGGEPVVGVCLRQAVPGQGVLIAQCWLNSWWAAWHLGLRKV